MIDIYFDPEYGKIHEKIEGGKSECFLHETDYGKIQHMFIIRPIEIELKGESWYDIITPYGYGGPLILECEEGREVDLVEDFHSSFSIYCKENKVVSEFIRFHPIIGNAIDFKSHYEVTYDRNTIGTRVDLNSDIKEFSKSARKTIRHALNRGITYKVTRSPNDISDFEEIYYDTMDRNEAEDFYYFDKEYFNSLMAAFPDNILSVEAYYEDEVIAAAFYFVYNEYIHAHLSGTKKGFLELSPAYVIKHATLEWAEENNIKIIHYGGGVTSSEDDSLYKFKKKFTRSSEYMFYTGKKIWNDNVYKQLCESRGVGDTSFFPAYRSI